MSLSRLFVSSRSNDEEEEKTGRRKERAKSTLRSRFISFRLNIERDWNEFHRFSLFLNVVDAELERRFDFS